MARSVPQPNGHWCIVIGVTRVRVDGAVGPGDFVWLNCHHPHEHWAEPSDPWEAMWVRAEGPQLAKLSELVRERFKLFAKVRVLAAEGKLSAYILTGLPFGVAAVINIMNPKYLSVLFTDPAGINVVYGALAMMVLGIFAMWRIIDIKV